MIIFRNLFLALLMGCNTYTGVVIYKGNSYLDTEVKINDYHYVLPLLTIEENDSIKLGDTLIIDRKTLRLINN